MSPVRQMSVAVLKADMALSIVAAGLPDVLSNAIKYDFEATATYIKARANTT